MDRPPTPFDARAFLAARKGRILRLRMGYNPNSSSVGVVTIVFLWGMVAAAFAVNLAAAVIAARRSDKET